MRILLYEWEAYLQYDLEWILREKKINYDTFSWKFADKNQDEKFAYWLDKNRDLRHYDAVLSINYWPLLSVAAQKAGVRYIAWCYDNPLNVKQIEKTLGNPVNTVVFFDRIQAKRYIDAGFQTVYYLPLAVNTKRLGKIPLTDDIRRRFGADVSLVGSLYESRYLEIRNLFEEHSKGYVDAVLEAQQNMYGCYLFDNVITQEFVQQINDNIKKRHPETDFILLKEALTFAMASEVTRKDRLILLTLLGRRCDTKLYSFQSSEILQGVKVLPPVDYVSEMPQVFAASKINLNPTLRCIQSGIPLRALDIMGAGGFLLSNYQPELAELFAQEEEMVMYESIEDAVEKALFYLQHEELREEIAQAGRRKVNAYFTMAERLGQILELAGLSEGRVSQGVIENMTDCGAFREEREPAESKYDYYILAPAQFASGGPELAHQLCHELKEAGAVAYMYYTANGELEPVDVSALPKYQKYGTEHAKSYKEVDRQSVMMVINESATSYIPFFEKAHIALWWMSVDNYLIDPYKLSREEIKKHVDFHLVQSAYAYDYVKNQLGIAEEKIIVLSDYIPEEFQNRLFPDDVRQNLVLYNPKKGMQNLAPLMEMTPEVKWVPLINFDEDQLRKIMQISKVYVDLGNHPGKDRIPREAAVSGCCIITNKQGSAAYEEDVPIAEKYKFEKFQDCYEEMKALIMDICREFQRYTGDFEEYRKWICEERERFTKDTAHMIRVMNGGCVHADSIVEK